MKQIKFSQLFLVALMGGIVSVLGLKTYDYFTEKKALPHKGFGINEDMPVQYASYIPNLTGSNLDFTFAAEMTVHAVVNIRTEYQQKSSVYDDFFGGMDPFRDFFGNDWYKRSQQPIMATGSGVIVSPDGYIITNNHVVQESDYIEVTLNNKESFPAKVIGTDASTDLALLKIESTNLPYVIFGNSDSVRIGEWVLAVGNPFNLNSTVTAGIVSAKARDINILGKNDAIETFIQTDAAVNRGNSGGALVNTKGELIGINAAIASNTGSYTGYSFAIPVNIVKKVFKDLLDYGQVQRAYMGVEVADMTSKLAEEKGIAKVPGVYVSNVVENSAAENAGLEAGDIIIEMEGKALSSASELLEIVATKSPGESIKVIYMRGSKQSELSVKLKNKYNNYDLVKSDKESIVNALGATFENLPKEEANRLGLRYGVKVKNIGSGKLRSYGVREGFIITSIDKTPVSNTDELYNIIKNKKGGVLIEGVYPNGVRAYYGFGL